MSGENFYLFDVGNFTTGDEIPGNSSCIGLVVAIWTQHLVVFRFGSAYDSFDHWYLSNGDQYEITLLGGATASGPLAGLKKTWTLDPSRRRPERVFSGFESVPAERVPEPHASSR